MSSQKPKKDVIGESKVMPVSKGFAIPMVILFMSILLCFSVLWGGVLIVDAAVDNFVNPIMLRVNPDAEPIDVMAIMSPPTSEANAAKTYAEFPTLDVEAMLDPIKASAEVFPGNIGGRVQNVCTIIADLASSYYQIKLFDIPALYQWYSTDLQAATVAVSSQADDMLVWDDESLSPALGNAVGILSKTVDTYPAGIEAWYNDHLPFRSIIFNTNGSIESYVESPYSSVQNKMAEMIDRFVRALLIMQGKDDPSATPPGEDLGDPFDPDDPFNPDNQDPPSDDTEEPEETPPPFIDDPEEPGDNETGTGDDQQGNTGVCEHEYDEGRIETPATCTDWGVMKYTCTKCGKTKGAYTAKASHDYVAQNPTAQVCGKTYTITSVCSACKDSKFETVIKTHVQGTVIAKVDPSYATYGYTLVECSDCKGQYRTDLKNKLYSSDYFLPIQHSDRMFEGKEQWLFYKGDNSIAYFEGSNLMTDAELQEYVSVMNTLSRLCKERGIQLQICIWPNKNQVYSEYTGLNAITTTKRVDRLVEYVQANSDVKIIYPLKELKAMKPYADMYLKYDTHWNCAGGFVGYQAMLASLGLETTDFRNCQMYDSYYSSLKDPYYSNVRGDLLGMGISNPGMYPNDHNYYVVYRPEVTVDSHAGGNGAGDTRHTTAANAPNDLNFVMLADSYRVMQLSYLERDFTDCFLTHRNRVNDADVKEAIKNSDILVIAAVERLETNILDTAKQIIIILEEDAK